MKFHNNHNGRLPKHLLWDEVMLPDRASTEVLDKWCDDYDSTGRYYRRRRIVYAPNGNKSYFSLWYFELTEDAVLFALKFTA